MNWTSRSRYYLVGVSLDIPLFNGGRNNYKIRESLLDLKSSQLSLANTARQLEMSTELARNNLHTAYQTYTASQQRLRAAQSYYRLIEKGYKEGSAAGKYQYLPGTQCHGPVRTRNRHLPAGLKR
jgi:outer membrane protein